MPRTMQHPFLILLAAGLLIIALGAAGPIPQLPDYHAFADQRPVFGIEHGADVLSNLGFLLVGGWGFVLASIRKRRGDAGGLAWLVFFGALVFTGFGSAWYHLAPDDTRLIWDRTPIALACAALLSASVAQAVPGRWWTPTLLPVLSAVGTLSVLWWYLSGDLRYYLLIQVAPLVLVPLLQWLSGAAAQSRRAFGLAVALYVLAKVCELNDARLLEALGAVSGHTLKHLLATAAAFVLAVDFARSPP
jgi:hypothetical protein